MKKKEEQERIRAGEEEKEEAWAEDEKEKWNSAVVFNFFTMIL